MAEYTTDGLPVVSKDTFESLVALAMRDKKKKEADDFMQIVQRENPMIDGMLTMIVTKYGESDYSAGFAAGLRFTYELLMRQAAANKLEEKLGR